MYTKHEASDIERELKGIFAYGNIILDEHQTMFTDILGVFERECSESFMQGYQYAISILKDGIVKKEM